MGSRLHGNDGRRRRTHTVIPATRRRLHNRHSRESGNPGVGFPAKKSTHLHDICVPQRELRKGLRTRESTRGVGMGSRLHGNDGRRRRTHTVIPATRRRLHNRHSRESGNPGVGFPAKKSTHLHDICLPQRELRKGLRTRESTRGVGMGSRLHGNDGRRRRTHTVIPAREVTPRSLDRSV